MISGIELVSRYFPFVDPAQIFTNRERLDREAWDEVGLSQFNVVNESGADLSQARVWVPTAAPPEATSYKFRVMAAPEASVFALCKPKSGSVAMVLRGENQRVAIFSESAMKIQARLVGEADLVIGENTAIMGARILLNKSSVSIGCNGLWSDEVILQGSDQHGIVDLATKKVINSAPAKTVLERHVWLGRRCMVLKGLTIGQGSIIGAGAIVAKSVPKACVAVGNPAKPVRHGVSWCDRFELVEGLDADEIEALAGLEEDGRLVAVGN